MSSSTYAGHADSAVTGFCPAPPPPPPPPVPGQVPAMRINIAQPATAKRLPANTNNSYEPPAAIQNAMLTKDKKPFTYTPGMGGKLDLSQIRSPRMARRVAKNANDEGIEGPPKSTLEAKPTLSQTSPGGANPFVQPQVAVPVFPTNIPPPQPTGNRTPQLAQPSANRTPQSPQPPQTPPLANRLPANQANTQGEPVRNTAKIETKITPVAVPSPTSPESPSTPTQVTLQKAPTPWLQNKNKPQEELPEWAKRSSGTKSSNSTPESPLLPLVYTQQPQQMQPPLLQRQQNQQQQEKRLQPSPPIVQQLSSPQSQQAERIIPMRIEDRPSVFAGKHDAGHHQFKQPPSVHHQQRWGQSAQNQAQPQMTSTTQHQPSQQSGGAFVIPIMVEGGDRAISSGPVPMLTQPQHNARMNSADNQQPPRLIIQQRGAPIQQGQFGLNEPGPVQSRSFRVLQKMTDTDSPNDVDTEQMRKLQLTEDDRNLMNKFKEQVDGDTYLHQEEDPRYRGAAIPSRAFRYLQNMTDSGEISTNTGAPRPQNVVNKRQNRNSKSFDGAQANLPPSEQQAPEPKKYMGSAIPSRSFRILQAMTAPESVATQENHQADYTCQTDNSAPGNQQGIFFPPCPPPLPFWTPDDGGCWWGYYPIRYAGANANNNPKLPYDAYLPYLQGNNTFAYYPMYNQSRPFYQQYNPINPGNMGYDDYNYFKAYAQSVSPSHCEQNNLDQHYCESCNNDRTFSNCHDDGTVGRNTACSVPSLRNLTTEFNIKKSDSAQQWSRSSNASRSSTVSNRDSDCTTAMNITDQEESVPEVTVVLKTVDKLDSTKTNPSKRASLNITVPNYTYIDSSDSSDPEFNTDEESLVDSCETGDNRHNNNNSGNNNNNNNNNSNNDDSNDSNDTSDSDSDSYLAYSTGLNPHGRYDGEFEIVTGTSYNNDVCLLDKFNTTDCESDAEYEDGGPVEILEADSATHHDLSVTREDAGRADSKSSYRKDQKVGRETEHLKEADDLPDDNVDSATVSVSLPLRFTFSISENNEDVTTVIVGDSTIKPEKRFAVKNGAPVLGNSQPQLQHEWQENGALESKVCNETAVDITLRKLPHLVAVVDADKEERNSYTPRNDDQMDQNDSIPHVNFTLRRVPSRVNIVNSEETIETEFTFRAKKLDDVSRVRRNRREEYNNDVEGGTSNQRDDGDGDFLRGSLKPDEGLSDEKSQHCSEEIQKEIVMMENTNFQDTNSECTNGQNEDNEDIDFWAEIRGSANHDSDAHSQKLLKPTVVVSECNCTDETNVGEAEREDRNADTITEQHEMADSFPAVKNEEGENDNADTCQIVNETKHLLSVQNSREETDDEDSGVTSDMSRMISEADTDSECTTTRKTSKYQRTQTHSRLFRLLYDDSTLPEDSTGENTDRTSTSASQRKYLSLPLKGNVFNYDENYYSNYSSGLTSPEYSPVYEQSWRRLHETVNGTLNDRDCGTSQLQEERIACKEDPYFQAWKTAKPSDPHDEDVIPSLAFKILESKIPYWAYKVNVLCPRIKSTKSVPHTLQQGNGKSNSSMVPPVPTSYARNNRC